MNIMEKKKKREKKKTKRRKKDKEKKENEKKKGNKKRDHKLDPRRYSLVYDTGNWEEGNGLWVMTYD
jgi:hypothetical protein